jgi:hypothetical protein
MCAGHLFAVLIDLGGNKAFNCVLESVIEPKSSSADLDFLQRKRWNK